MDSETATFTKVSYAGFSRLVPAVRLGLHASGELAERVDIKLALLLAQALHNNSVDDPDHRINLGSSTADALRNSWSH